MKKNKAFLQNKITDLSSLAVAEKLNILNNIATKVKSNTVEECISSTNISSDFMNVEIEKNKALTTHSDSFEIAERKKEEEYIGHLAAIIESSEDAIISKTLSGIIKTWNKSSERIFGFTANEAIGKHISIIIPTAYIHEEKEIIDRIRNNETIEHYETIRNKKDGTQIYVSLTVSPIKDNKGITIGVSKIARDISIPKKSEEEFKQLTFKNKITTREISDYKYALDESSIVAITDQNGIIKYVNDNFCNISKYSAEELIGQDHNIVNSGYHSKEFIRNLWHTISNGKVWKGDLKNKAKDGSTYWVYSTIIPFVDEEGKPYQYISIRADITQRKQAEKKIILLNDSLEKRVNKRTEDLEMANKDLESFSYSVSHDLRAPLRAVNGYARMLEEDYNDLFDKEGKRLLGEVQKNAKKMGILIDDLLAFSRLGRKVVNKSLVDMNALTADVLTQINNSTPNHAVIKTNELLPIMADYSLMEHVMTNLISNAIKYSSKKENAEIEITSKKEEGVVVYTIKDNGVGFDMQYGHKIFGVFQRLHSSEEFDGTGVGLAIVYRIIQKHDGKIWAESKLGEYATFTFSLPDIN